MPGIGVGPISSGRGQEYIRERCRTEGDKPVADFVSALEELQELEPGWYGVDGIAGAAPCMDAIRGALHVGDTLADCQLPYPSVFPTVDGGVSLEWTLGGVEASLRFHDSSESATVASWNAATDEHRYEEDIPVNGEFVETWLRSLTGHAAR